MLGRGWFFAGLVSLTSSPYTSELLDDEISTSSRVLCILYVTLIGRKLSKPVDGRHRPKHVVFPLLINTIIEPYIHSCVFI